MQITQDLYFYPIDPLITQVFGRGFTCCCYILRQSINELWLIDAGSNTCGIFRRLLRRIRHDGLDPTTITKIFLTHAHPDHVSALPNWLKKTHAEVYGSLETREIIQSGFDLFMQNLYDLTDGSWNVIFPASFNIVKFVIRLKMGKIPKIQEIKQVLPQEEIKGKKYSIQAIPTPGHSPDHTAYLVPELQTLFGGDLIGLFVGKKAVLNLPHANFEHYLSSLEYIAQLPISRYCAGHMPISSFSTIMTPNQIHDLILGAKENLIHAMNQMDRFLDVSFTKNFETILKYENRLTDTLWAPLERKMMLFLHYHGKNSKYLKRTT